MTGFISEFIADPEIAAMGITPTHAAKADEMLRQMKCIGSDRQPERLERVLRANTAWLYRLLEENQSLRQQAKAKSASSATQVLPDASEIRSSVDPDGNLTITQVRAGVERTLLRMTNYRRADA